MKRLFLRRIIIFLQLFILLIVLVQCDLGNLINSLNPSSSQDGSNTSGGTSSYKYSIYNPDLNAHIVDNYHFSYPVTITSEYLFNPYYVWLSAIAGTRYLYQFTLFNGKPQVYSASVSSILKYERWQIYEDRKLVPTVIYTDSSGEWYMSFLPIFYQYKDEYAMNNDFNYNSQNNVIFTNIKPASKPIALKSEYLNVGFNKGFEIPHNLTEYQVKQRLINTEWYTMESDYSKRLTDNYPSYQFLQDNTLKVTTNGSDPSSTTNSISQGWSIWQTPTGEFNSYLNYIYIYDIKIIRIFLNYPSGTDFSAITINTNLDVLMVWYNPDTFTTPSAGPFTRYTIDKD